MKLNLSSIEVYNVHIPQHDLLRKLLPAYGKMADLLQFIEPIVPEDTLNNKYVSVEHPEIIGAALSEIVYTCFGVNPNTMLYIMPEQYVIDGDRVHCKIRLLYQGESRQDTVMAGMYSGKIESIKEC